MRTSMLGVAILVLAMTGAADAQFGLARFAAAVSDDRAAVRVWKHHLDAGTRRDIAERAAARSRTPDGARRITLKSEPTPAQQKRVTVTDGGTLAAPLLDRNPMGGGPAGRGTPKAKAAKKKPR